MGLETLKGSKTNLNSIMLEQNCSLTNVNIYEINVQTHSSFDDGNMTQTLNFCCDCIFCPQYLQALVPRKVTVQTAHDEIYVVKFVTEVNVFY